MKTLTQKEIGHNNMLVASKLKSTFSMDELPSITINGFIDENCTVAITLDNGNFAQYRVVIKRWVNGREAPYRSEFSLYGTNRYSTAQDVVTHVKEHYEEYIKGEAA